MKPGDRVMGHWRGGQAELVALIRRLLVKVPDRLSWIEAAAWLNVFVTSHDAMVTNAGLQRGESVLINAASSGIGVASLQIARWIGAKTCHRQLADTGEACRAEPFGIDAGVDASHSNWPDAVMEATEGRGVDVVIDSVGADVLGGNLRCMALRGRLVSVGSLASSAVRSTSIGVGRTAAQDHRSDISHPFAGGAHRLRAELRKRPARTAGEGRDHSGGRSHICI